MGSSDDLPDRPKGRTYGVPAAKQTITRLLSEAYARDDLEQTEFERRIERVEEARTIEELEELVEDFPEHLRKAIDTPTGATDAVRMTGDELETEIARLDGLSAPTTVNLLGDKHIVIRPQDQRVVRTVSVIGDCEIDLRGLTGEGGAVLVKVIGLIGETRIIVPKATTVDLRLLDIIGDHQRKQRSDSLVKKLAKKFGFLEEPEESVPALPGPTVVVTGFRLIGDTVVVED